MSFDPNAFLSTNFVDPTDTKKTPCPVGDYQATVDKLASREWRSSKDESNFGIAVDIFWSIQDQSVLDALEKDKVLVRQTIMFTCNPDGSLDMDKAKHDVSFGRLRDAVGLNEDEFNFNMLIGRSAIVKIKHSEYKGDLFDEVAGTTTI